MNRVWPVAALLSAVLLLVAGCTLGTNTKTGSNQPVTSPAAQASVGIPQSSPTSAGGTPASTPASTPSSQSTPSNAVLAITNLPFHNGEVGIGYTPIALGAGGGTPPYSWSISGGALPAGLSLTGAFPPPGPLGAFNMTVRVRDLYGAQQDVNANWYVFPHIVFSVGSAQCGPSYGCRIQIPYTMGTPNGTPTVSFSKITCGNQTCTGLA